VLFPVAAIAVLLAFVLSHLRMPSWAIATAGITSSLLVAFLVASEAFPGPIDSIRNFVLLFGATVEWVQSRQIGDLGSQQPLTSATTESVELLQDLFFRLESWFQAAFAFRISRDNTVFIFWMTLAAWGIGFSASWSTFRLRNAYLAVAPSTLAIGINITYVGADWEPFVIFLFASLALIVHTRMGRLEAKWDQSSTDYSEDLGPTVLLVSGGLIAAVVFLAVMLPRAAGNPLAETFWSYLGDDWGNVEAGIQRLFAGVSNPAGSSMTGRETLGLSGPEPFRNPRSLIIESTTPSYWRGQTFDTYTGQGWRSTHTTLDARQAGQPLTDKLNLSSRQASRSNVEILDSPSPLLYSPGDALRLNRPYLVQVAERGAQINEFASIRATRRVGQRLVYSIDSTLAAATSNELRQAPDIYPEWTARYIQIPELPPRVIEFGNLLADASTNNFDRVRATEFFMRRFPFAEDLDPLPMDRDATDFFLFDLRRGRSTLIASTMAVLVRSMGIPARLATGYTMGTFDPVTHRYFVNPSDAHSWVEVYFPSYGWVMFEPSGFQVPGIHGGPITDQSSDAESSNAASEDLSDVVDFLDELDDMTTFGFQPLAPPTERNVVQQFFDSLGDALLALIIISGTLLTLGILYLLGSIVRDRLQSPKTAVQRRYERMVRLANRAGYSTIRGFTPIELGRTLARDLFVPDEIGESDPSREKVTPPEMIVDCYTRAIYGKNQISRADKQLVDKAWRRVRIRLARRVFRLQRRAASQGNL
jgi:transglutaminase-like putative cysteine protease